jgi:hypothetical protein
MEDTGKYIRDRLAAAEITVKHLFTPEHGLSAQEEDHGNTRTKAGDPETIYRAALIQELSYEAWLAKEKNISPSLGRQCKSTGCINDKSK